MMDGMRHVQREREGKRERESRNVTGLFILDTLSCDDIEWLIEVR